MGLRGSVCVTPPDVIHPGILFPPPGQSKDPSHCNMLFCSQVGRSKPYDVWEPQKIVHSVYPVIMGSPFQLYFLFLDLSSLIVNIHFHCFRLTLVELPQCWWVGCIKIDTEPEQRRSITGRLRCISQEPRPGCQLGPPYGPPSPHQNPLLPSPRCLLPS